jgi:hypothetical protein
VIAGVLNVPKTAEEWATWTFNYQNTVHEIDAKLQSLGVFVPQYQLDPLPPDDKDDWLSRVQQSHNDFNTALGLQGSDLSSVELSDVRQLEAWVWLLYLEISTARLALGI